VILTIRSAKDELNCEKLVGKIWKLTRQTKKVHQERETGTAKLLTPNADIASEYASEEE